MSDEHKPVKIGFTVDGQQHTAEIPYDQARRMGLTMDSFRGVSIFQVKPDTFSVDPRPEPFPECCYPRNRS